MATIFNNKKQNVVLVEGLDEHTSRNNLYKSFMNYGKITKVYIPENNAYAKIYYSTNEEARAAVENFQKSGSTWTASLKQHRKSPMDMDDELDNLQMNSSYVDIHGRTLDVLENESGEIFIPLKDIRKTGFAVFQKDNYDPTLISKGQIFKEFNLHLLAEARKFLLSHKVNVLGEPDILKAIQKCQEILLDDSNSPTKPSNSIPQWDKTSSPQTQGGLRAPRNFDVGKDNFVASSPKPLTKFNVARINQEFRPSACGFNNDNSINDKNKFKKKSDNNGSSSDSSIRNTKYVVSEHVKQVEFEPMKPVQVYINVFEREKIGWAVLTEHRPIQDDLLLKINKNALNMPVVPKPNLLSTVYIAEKDKTWSRVLVRNLHPLQVHFIDFGTTAEVKCVRQVPSNMADIPAQAVRIRQCDTDKGKLIVGKDLMLLPKKKYDDGTYIVSIAQSMPPKPATKSRNDLSSATPIKPPEKSSVGREKFVEETWDKKSEPKVFLDSIPPLTTIQDAVKVMVLDCDGQSFLLRSRDCNDQLKKITDYIKDLNKSDLTLTNVKNNQLVLCARDNLPGLHRAQVVDIESNIVTVKYIDYPGDESMSIKSLRNVDQFIADFPSTMIQSPKIKNLSDHIKNSKVRKLIDDLINEGGKLRVCYNNNEFDLEHDGNLLSEQIKDLVTENNKPEKPKPKEIKAENKQKHENAVKYETMDFVKLKIGVSDYLCYSFESMDQITLLSMDEKELQWFADIAELNVEDNEPYYPECQDMCLAKYSENENEEASWYRGVVLEIKDNKYNVMFIDYGNITWLTSEDLRIYPQSLKKIPILGVLCELVGVPRNEKIYERLKLDLVDGETISVYVKSVDDNFKYQIEIPDLYKQLKSEGLC